MEKVLNYICLQPIESLSPTETEDENGQTIYKIDATNDFTMSFPVDKSLPGFNLTIVAEGIDDTGTVRLWQDQQGTVERSTVTDWNTLLDNDGNQASITVTAADLVSVINVNIDAVNNGFVGLDFAKGSISTGTVYVLYGF